MTSGPVTRLGKRGKKIIKGARYRYTSDLLPFSGIGGSCWSGIGLGHITLENQSEMAIQYI